MKITLNVKKDLDVLMRRYFKANPDESYDTLLEELIIARLEAIAAAALLT